MTDPVDLLEKVRELVGTSTMTPTEKLNSIADLTRDYVDPGFGMRIGSKWVSRFGGIHYVDSIHYKVCFRSAEDDQRYDSAKAPSTMQLNFVPLEKFITDVEMKMNILDDWLWSPEYNGWVLKSWDSSYPYNNEVPLLVKGNDLYILDRDGYKPNGKPNWIPRFIGKLTNTVSR